MPRHPNSNLTAQQQRVLELMALGRTNPEIADALGITLDGAKYHVREVFDKLGVDSREEAIAVWRAGRPGLLQRLRGLLWPVGAIAAGVGVAAVAMVIFVVIPASGGAHTSSTTVASPDNWQVWIASIEANYPAQTTTLRVLSQNHNGRLADEHSVNGRFAAAAWSVNGAFLAVASQPTGSTSVTTITIYDRDTWKSHGFQINDAVTAISWSPDGDYLALGGVGVVICQPNGHRVAELPGQSDKEAIFGWWSPQSNAFSVVVGGKLQIVNTDGAVETLNPPPNTMPDMLTPLPWTDSETTRALAFRPTGGGNAVSVVYAIHLGNKVKWQLVGPGQPQNTSGLSGAARALAEVPVNMHASDGVTADGEFGWSILTLPTARPKQFPTTLTLYKGRTQFGQVVLDNDPDHVFQGVALSVVVTADGS